MRKQDDGTVETKLAYFLLRERITRHGTTGESPSQLRCRRSLRSHLDLLRPDVGAKVHAAQARQKKQHDQHSQKRQVEVGNAVNERNYSGDPKWISGTVIQDTGPLSTTVELQDGTMVRRHPDQLVTRPAGDPSPGFPASVPNSVVQEPAIQNFTLYVFFVLKRGYKE
ncbi:uncharacterized protein [Montipora foliosa]|uniref:uncharacterized protein n=1 Tax=Montipora foliosa TaxID=591990 RepID=UPI0035F15A82